MANLISAIAALQGRKRKCPQCGHQQAVTPFLASQPVACHRCAATIPPPETAGKTRAPRAAAKGNKPTPGSRR